MIKILFFIETLEGGGAEKVLRDLVNHMDQERFDITVHTVWPCDAKQYLNDGIRYRSVYSSCNRFNRLCYRVEAALGLTYFLHIRDNYDIECAYLECGTTKIMASSTNRKAKKLAWVHCDLRKAMGNPTGFAEQTKRYYEKYDRVVCVSQNVRESFSSLFGDEIPADVVYNTVDDAAIREKAAQPLPDGIIMPEHTVVSLGRLTDAKNYTRLLTVHKRLLAEGIRHKLWILGEGSEREALQTYIDENGLERSAELVGFRSNPYPYLRGAELLVCSSDFEGLSTFVTEGLILGKAIVTTDCGGMHELLGASEFGLITELSEDGLYEGMKHLLTNKAAREHYAAMAARRGADFSASALAAKTEDFLMRLLNS